MSEWEEYIPATRGGRSAGPLAIRINLSNSTIGWSVRLNAAFPPVERVVYLIDRKHRRFAMRPGNGPNSFQVTRIANRRALSAGAKGIARELGIHEPTTLAGRQEGDLFVFEVQQ